MPRPRAAGATHIPQRWDEEGKPYKATADDAAYAIAELAAEDLSADYIVPSPLDPPSGCHFRTRCWKAQDICAVDYPALVDRGQGHPSACHFAEVLQVVKTSDAEAPVEVPAPPPDAVALHGPDGVGAAGASDPST